MGLRVFESSPLDNKKTALSGAVVCLATLEGSSAMDDGQSIGACLDVNKFRPALRSGVGEKPRPGSSAKLLATQWPLTYRACVETYFSRVNFVLVDSAGHCDAGYMLNAVIAMKQLYDDTHGHRPVVAGTVDLAAAREIRYHFTRGHKFSNAKAALYKCLLNLVVERPERFR